MGEAVLNFPPAAKLPTNKLCQSQNLSLKLDFSLIQTRHHAP